MITRMEEKAEGSRIKTENRMMMCLTGMGTSRWMPSKMKCLIMNILWSRTLTTNQTIRVNAICSQVVLTIILISIIVI